MSKSSETNSSAKILLEQINKRWPDRDKSKDNLENPFVLSISKNLNGQVNDDQWLCDQLIAYARNNIKGSKRLASVGIGNLLSSNMYSSYRWQWFTSEDMNEIKVSFSNKVFDIIPFDVPVLFASGNQWDAVVPFFDNVELDMQKRSKTTDMYRIACRLSELGFYTGKVLPDGQQSLPVSAIINMQDFMGLSKQPYNPHVHKELWKELRFSK